MSWLDDLTPTNLAAEKAKFLADTTYNPQFVYSAPIEESKLTSYGFPKPKYLELAQEILDKAYFGRNYADLMMMEGKVISDTEVNQRIHTFLKMHGLEKRFNVVWSASFVSRATIDTDTIKLRQHAEFREEGLLSMIYHEIGTHAIRRINYEKQPWYKKRSAFGMPHTYLPTEEGLATLNGLLPKSFTSMYATAVRYMAVEYARTHSFAQLWKFVARYIQDIDTQWMITFRQKRGVTDTTGGVGYTKDLVYFEGALKVWNWLKQHDFDPTPLYLGKVGLEDVAVAQELNPKFKPLLPSFYVLDPSKYAEKIAKIGLDNNFPEVL